MGEIVINANNASYNMLPMWGFHQCESFPPITYMLSGGDIY